MPEPVLLTDEEIAQLTDCPRKSDQIEELRRRGWVFEVSSKGRPKVGRAYAVGKLGGSLGPAAAPGDANGATGIDLDALDRLNDAKKANKARQLA
jgi:hypothetical protein